MSDLQAVITTTKGDINLTLYADKCPVTVANWVNLAKKGFYEGITFHRVIDNFMVQCGCPHGTGTGDPGYRFEDEFHADLKHDRPGILSMANAGPGTNGSQFFITHVPTPWLDGKHSVFGSVVGQEDQDVVNKIKRGDRIESIAISGDVDALLASQADRVADWNKALGE
jgi:peptidyl-prolyl cis-trans isomerase B (cyclophilin B)